MLAEALQAKERCRSIRSRASVPKSYDQSKALKTNLRGEDLPEESDDKSHYEPDPDYAASRSEEDDFSYDSEASDSEASDNDTTVPTIPA